MISVHEPASPCGPRTIGRWSTYARTTRTGWKGGRFPALTDALTKMLSMRTEPTNRGMITHLSRDPDRAMRVTTITVGGGLGYVSAQKTLHAGYIACGGDVARWLGKNLWPEAKTYIHRLAAMPSMQATVHAYNEYFVDHEANWRRGKPIPALDPLTPVSWPRQHICWHNSSTIQTSMCCFISWQTSPSSMPPGSHHSNSGTQGPGSGSSQSTPSSPSSSRSGAASAGQPSTPGSHPMGTTSSRAPMTPARRGSRRLPCPRQTLQRPGDDRRRDRHGD